jgi:predicted RNase H-like HicB family nuclease
MTGYSAYIPELQGCVSTGSFVEEVKKSISDAIVFHLERMKQHGFN